MNKFWAFEQQGDERVLRLDGAIAEESWWGDEVTPAAFRAELNKHPGDLTVWINSPGGDVIAGSQIYTMLMEHKGMITVKIDGLAASAASVVAMAGDKVCMSPSAYMMIHLPWTFGIGNSEDFKQLSAQLDEIAEGIVLSYETKTSLSREELLQMMQEETWMSARSAVEKGFADEILYQKEAAGKAKAAARPMVYACASASKQLGLKMQQAAETPAPEPDPPIDPPPEPGNDPDPGTPADEADKTRMALLLKCKAHE